MNLDRIPLLKTVVIKIIQGLICDVLLFPNCVPIAIAADSTADEPGTLLKSLELQPIGVLHVKVIAKATLPTLSNKR
jgi:Ca2+-dependent lipid-binding protein